MWLNFKNNNFLHLSVTEKRFIIWNSILLQSIIIKDVENLDVTNPDNLKLLEKSILNKLRNERRHDDLENTFFSFEYCNNLRKQYIEKFIKKPNISSIYIVLNRSCNLKCEYCHLEKLSDTGSFSEENIEKCIKWLVPFLNTNCENPNVIFYGGEPLLSIRPLKKAIKLINRFKKLNLLPSGLKLSLVTNGTLLNSKIASFLSDNDVFVTISIDGTQASHDSNRIGKKTINSFKETLHGYELLKKYGVETGISTTITSKNIDTILSDLSSFLIKLNPVVISYNIYRPGDKNVDKNNLAIDGKILGRVLFEAYDICIKNNVIETRASRIIESVIFRQPRMSDCAGCGQQFSIYPNGTITPCQIITDFSKNKIGSIHDEKINLDSNKVLDAWLHYSPLLQEQCYSCPAIACCGGGCRLLFVDPDKIEYQKIYCDYAKKVLSLTLNKISDKLLN